MEARARRRPQLRLLLLLLLCGGCPRVGGCNETRMLEKLPRCGKAFADMMHKVDVWKWCNLSEFIVNSSPTTTVPGPRRDWGYGPPSQNHCLLGPWARKPLEQLLGMESRGSGDSGWHLPVPSTGPGR
ncbi:receptor activity-modifying protein 3 isoform X2 [Vulpes lagopus]|uniref:receptor activity-modifying protein 3 isoform X2 n=1 Tax=Vulpes lagopus TaxID=494514 RepID=UPI001BCA606B|nr:receptor activity-modifying protein 3 isoform X2 [Vulpes lagopus]